MLTENQICFASKNIAYRIWFSSRCCCRHDICFASKKIAYRIWFCSRCCCRHKISQSSSISWRAWSVCMTSQSQHNVHPLVSGSAGWPICWIADTICLQIFYLLNSDVICSQNQICNRKNWLANFAARVKLYPYRIRPVGWYVLWYIPTTPSVYVTMPLSWVSQTFICVALWIPVCKTYGDTCMWYSSTYIRKPKACGLKIT